MVAGIGACVAGLLLAVEWSSAPHRPVASTPNRATQGAIRLGVRLRNRPRRAAGPGPGGQVVPPGCRPSEPAGQYDLGQRYELGVGVPVNRIEAVKWLTLASDQGQVDAAQRRDTLKKTMTRSDIAKAKRRVAAFSHAQ